MKIIFKTYQDFYYFLHNSYYHISVYGDVDILTFIDNENKIYFNDLLLSIFDYNELEYRKKEMYEYVKVNNCLVINNIILQTNTKIYGLNTKEYYNAVLNPCIIRKNKLKTLFYEKEF